MAQGYLVKAKNFLEEVKENFFMEWDGNNYQIYFPEEKILVGYFSDENFKPSNQKFVKKVTDEKIRFSLDDKIIRGKVKKSIEIDYSELTRLKNLYLKVFSSKNSFLENFNNFDKIISQR